MLNTKSDAQMKKLALALDKCCDHEEKSMYHSRLRAISVKEDRTALAASDAYVIVIIQATRGRTVDELADRLSHYVGYTVGEVEGASYLETFERIMREYERKDPAEDGFAVEPKRLEQVSRVFKVLGRPMVMRGWTWQDLEPDYEVLAIVNPVKR